MNFPGLIGYQVDTTAVGESFLLVTLNQLKLQ